MSSCRGEGPLRSRWLTENVAQGVAHLHPTSPSHAVPAARRQCAVLRQRPPLDVGPMTYPQPSRELEARVHWDQPGNVGATGTTRASGGLSADAGAVSRRRTTASPYHPSFDRQV
jgi:hypothetical protein